MSAASLIFFGQKPLQALRFLSWPIITQSAITRPRQPTIDRARKSAATREVSAAATRRSCILHRKAAADWSDAEVVLHDRKSVCSCIRSPYHQDRTSRPAETRQGIAVSTRMKLLPFTFPNHQAIRSYRSPGYSPNEDAVHPTGTVKVDLRPGGTQCAPRSVCAAMNEI